MAHALHIVGSKASMAFVGETPWHGLGQALTEGASKRQWITEAGFDWQALTATPQFIRADGSTGRMADKTVIYRSDTGEPLSVMGSGYQIVQPRECIDFFDSLIAGHGMHLHTAGILDGGRRMWALARNGHGGEIVPGDRVDQYLMLATSLDGTTATVATWTATRVVCANTIAVALRDASRHIGAAREAAKHGRAASKASAVRVSHKSTFDADGVKAQMGLADESWKQFQADAQALADKGVSMEQARDILRSIFGQPIAKTTPAAPVEAAAPASAPAGKGGDFAALLAQPLRVKVDAEAEARADMARIMAKGDAREQKSVQRCLELFAGEGRGADHPGVKGTAWGLLNAVTEHIDHEQGRARDTRLQSAWFGRGAQFKADALDKLLTF